MGIARNLPMRSSRSVQGSAVAQRATLRLTRGLSTHVRWLLHSGANSAVITIGAGSGCDWQVHASGVAAHAMSIGFIDGDLWAAAGPDAYVTVGRNPLPEAWTRVPEHTTFQLGAAQLELSSSDLDHEDLSAEGSRVPLTDTKVRDAAAHVFSDGAWSPSLLGARADRKKGFTLVRVAGFLLLMAASYFAWLVLLDNV
jgi:hypothetical protein